MQFLSLGRMAASACVLGLALSALGLVLGSGLGTFLLLAGVFLLGVSLWMMNDLRTKLAGRLDELAQKQSQAKAGAKA